ncbi:thiol reductant ABC exporter subunit CydC [Bradyrhizobium sp. 170]|uniref:thiol reductant ABC exporter subunit CydC n=1 Tax=Bradyrhizobium sp. 170 TaxID=2782641 RepID=UPI001FFEA542|nr:thiol reductant ABC exporter subunit CydC [Bradyrhizobium sp. 170]UPK07110.1 thiol reductant ABC exporter subunit CydC [Bradyrhizobium sp. 170]
MTGTAALLEVLWSMIRFAPWRFISGVALAALTLAAGAGLLALSGYLIAGSAIAAIGLVAFDMVIPSATIRLFAIVRTVARYAERLATHDTTFRFIAGLRANVFRSIADGRGELARTQAGVLLARLSSDLDALDGLSIHFATPLFAAAVILTGFAVILWGISPLLAAATITPVLLGGVLAPCLIGVFATRDARRRMLALDAARTRLADLDRGRTELCIAGALAAHAEGVAAASKLAAETELRLIQLAAGLRLAGSLGSQGAILGALLSGAALVGSHNATPLMFAAIVVFSFSLGEVVAPLRLAALDLGRWTLAARRVRLLLGDQIATTDKPVEHELANSLGDLKLVDVSFTFPGENEPVAKDISLRVAPGETVALVGPSGGGKSTILSLAAGLLTPDCGAVALGGEGLSRPGRAASGGRIGYLLQRTELFRGSIADNLLMGRLDASDDELQIAVAAVGLDQAIANLPKGLHHQLGDGGTGLSGGERRRLGIARLLIASPDVYVFDEATEGLDAATAALVIENIRFETRGRAVLLATHHRDEADNADTLLWIEKGKLTQMARRGETAFDAILDQLNPRSCRGLDPGRGGRLAEHGGRIPAAGLVGAG